MSKDMGDRVESIFTQQERSYFLNNTDINKFSEGMIRDLAFLKIIKELLSKDSPSYRSVEILEYDAFNLLINQIELERGNCRVEVGVIGSFSSGKSTFINSLFGKPICPMAVKPTTSSITKFYYGYKERITVNGEEISKDEYYSYAQHIKGDSENINTHYIEYAYPFDTLNSIILYDTPGFNNNLNFNDTKVTMKTLESVDVIFFLVDISKGAIDMSSIERLNILKDKRMYCILNKSDLKSAKAINKIKDEIVSKKIFLEVVEYSSSKVLEFGDVNYIADYFRYIEKELIPKKSDFSSSIKGVLNKKRGRVKTKQEYKLYLDNNEYIIDDFYIQAKEQKIRVEKMLNRLSESKHFTLKQKLKKDTYKYHQNTLLILENLKSTEDSDSVERLNRELESFIKEKKEDVTRL
jgi:small GTP-binding protein